MNDIDKVIRSIPGPILVIGASGFLGANLFLSILKVRKDVFGTIHGQKAWRLVDVPSDRLVFLDLLSPGSQQSVLDRVGPQTIFNCSAFGAYSFEKDFVRIHQTNYLSTIYLLEKLKGNSIHAYVHAGSSSEYGLNCEAPLENALMLPDSHYSISKGSASLAVKYYGKVKDMPCVNLRLYSLYGPYEDSSRLIPTLAEKILQGKLPPFVNPDVSRDFLYVEDAVHSFLVAASKIDKQHYGESYNVGTGVKTTIRDLAELACDAFHLSVTPDFGAMQSRSWDHRDWYANPKDIKDNFGWEYKTPLREGLVKTVEWWRSFLQTNTFTVLTKNRTYDTKNSVSAIVACYKDGQAIPYMYERLKKTFDKLDLDYEIIFVNDCSPDDSTEQIQKISETDANVIGIIHSRNFGSQSAFRSGMEVATKEACVLLDGDLQDPPELIEEFVEKWRAGADVVYGRRVHREMQFWLEACYKFFYYIFASIGEIKIPQNAGDFSLIDHKVVRCLLLCEERDLFLRGLRAYVGFNQVGVDYNRPERMFGRSTNNLLKNIGWAKKAIFSYSRTPLHVLTFIGFATTVMSIILTIAMVISKLVAPDQAPRGITMVSLIIIFFGSLNIFGLGLLGEYIGKIIEEAKKRPSYIRVSKIAHGEVSPWKE